MSRATIMDNLENALEHARAEIAQQSERTIGLQISLKRKDDRIDELLKANNEYLQRARDAEGLVKKLREETAVATRVRPSDSGARIDHYDEPFYGDA